MKNLKRKGFTIVELVIVIAVVAILAAVLIPTFSSLIKKANVSADQQAIVQMNKALAVYEAENGKPESYLEAKKALEEGLINVEGGLTPITQGYAFYWNPEKNIIELVGDKIPEEGWILLANNGYGTVVNVSSLESLKSSISSSSNENPVVINLTADLEVSDIIEINNGNCVTLNLNGQNLEATVSAEVGKYEGLFMVKEGGSLTVTGEGQSEIVVNSANLVYNVFYNQGNLTLKDVNLSTNGYAGVKPMLKSETIIKNCTIKTTLTDDFAYPVATDSSSAVDDGTRVYIENSTLESACGYGLSFTTNSRLIAKNTTISGKGKVDADSFCAANLKDGTLSFENCTFISGQTYTIELSHGGAGYSGILNITFTNCKVTNTESTELEIWDNNFEGIVNIQK